MKISKAVSYCVLLSSLLVGASRHADAATYTISFTSSGISPASLEVQVGDVINWDGSFAYLHKATLTDPDGASITILDHCCPDHIVSSFTVRIPGRYTYVDSVQEDRGYSVYLGRFSAKPVAPVISVDIASLDFGKLEFGSTKRISFTVTNLRSVPVTIDALTHEESCFSIEEHLLPLTIGSGEAKVLSVLFNPSKTGRVADTLSVRSSDVSLLSIPIQAEVVQTLSAVRDNQQSAGLSMTINHDRVSGAANLRFVADHPYDLRLVLFDGLGRQVYANEHLLLNTGECTLPLASETLPTGDYYLRAISGGAAIATAKVMIAH